MKSILFTIALLFTSQFASASLLRSDTIFYDGFEDGVLDSVFWSGTSTQSFGLIEVRANARRSGVYGVALASSRDNSYNINRLDLQPTFLTPFKKG